MQREPMRDFACDFLPKSGVCDRLMLVDNAVLLENIADNAI